MSQAQNPVRAHLRHMKLEGKSPITIYHRERTLARLAAVLDVPLIDATADDLYEWRAALSVAGPTVAGYVSHVQGFYDWLVERGHLGSSPAAGLPVPPVPRRFPHPISEEDLACALDHASGRVRLWLILAAWCGLRACEIAGLRAESIRLRADEPYILVTIETVKGGRTEHRVPVCPSAAAEIAAAGLPSAGRVFLRADGAPLRPWLVSKLCNELLHDLGIASTLHDLRARFATKSYDVSHDIRGVQEMLGHRRVETTVIYTYVGHAAQSAIVAALPPVPGRGRVA